MGDFNDNIPPPPQAITWQPNPPDSCHIDLAMAMHPDTPTQTLSTRKGDVLIDAPFFLRIFLYPNFACLVYVVRLPTL